MNLRLEHIARSVRALRRGIKGSSPTMQAARIEAHSIIRRALKRDPKWDNKYFVRDYLRARILVAEIYARKCARAIRENWMKRLSNLGPAAHYAANLATNGLEDKLVKEWTRKVGLDWNNGGAR